MAKNDFDALMSVGVDIGKDVFHLDGFDKEGQLVLRKKIKRMVIIDQVTNESAARVYSQQGHGKIQKPIQRPDTYQRLSEDVQLNTCEQQPVHTSGLTADLRRCSVWFAR